MTAERPERPVPPAPSVPPEIRQLIESWPAIPAFVCDRHLTVLAANDLARSLSPAFHVGANLVRATFVDSDVLSTDPRSDLIAGHITGLLRRSLARYESDDEFEAIVADLSERSRAFAAAWADHTDGRTEPGTYVFRHQVVGRMTLAYQQLEVPRFFGLTLVVWRPADDDSKVALGRLAELASGAAEA